MLTPKQRPAIWLFAIGCVLLVAGILLWVASGSPTTADICDEGGQAKIENCATYNIILVTLWHLREWLHSVEGIITALATAAIAAFTWTLWQSSEKMWGVTKISADAAEKSAEIAQHTLIAAHRPWVSLDPTNGISITSPLTFDSAGGARMGVLYIFRNTGNSPALNVRWRNKLIILSMTKLIGIEISEQQSVLCDQIGEILHDLGDMTIFPGDKITQAGIVSVTLSDIETAEEAREAGPMARSGFISPVLIIGIDYQTSLLAPEHHQTRYAFQLGIPMGGGFMGDIRAEGTPAGVSLIYFSQSAD